MPRQVPLPAAPVTMVELSTKVSKTLNKTTPGIQIWRIEVGTGHSLGTHHPGTHHQWVWGGGGREDSPPFSSQCLGLGGLSVARGVKPAPVLGLVTAGCMGLGWGGSFQG